MPFWSAVWKKFNLGGGGQEISLENKHNVKTSSFGFIPPPPNMNLHGIFHDILGKLHDGVRHGIFGRHVYGPVVVPGVGVVVNWPREPVYGQGQWDNGLV